MGPGNQAYFIVLFKALGNNNCHALWLQNCSHDNGDDDGDSGDEVAMMEHPQLTIDDAN